MSESQEKIICSKCKEEIVDGNYTYGNINEDLVCIYCEEQSYESASTLVKVSAEGFETVKFTDISAYDQHGEVPSWFYELIVDTSKVQSWKSSDAWRGFYSSAENFKLKVLTEGWTTGWADEYHKRKISLNEFLSLFESRELVPPLDLFVLVEPTSNVFSTAITFLAREEDEEELAEWLEAVDYSIDHLELLLG